MTTAIEKRSGITPDAFLVIKKKEILYNLPLRPSQVHSICHDLTPGDPERKEMFVLRNLSIVGVIGRESQEAGEENTFGLKIVFILPKPIARR